MLTIMNRFLRVAGMILLVFAPAYATTVGWPLEKGKTFLALSASAVWPEKRPIELPDIYDSTYAEHGLGAGLTLGLDLGSPDTTRKDRMKTVAFMRYTLTPSSAKHQLSLDLGAEIFEGSHLVRLGASYGKGFQSFNQNSWITIDAHALHHPTLRRTSVWVDATYGVSFTHGKLMAQISAFQRFDGTRTSKFTPSYAHDLGHGRHIEIDMNIDLQNTPDTTLKLGIWQEF